MGVDRASGGCDPGHGQHLLGHLGLDEALEEARFNRRVLRIIKAILKLAGVLFKVVKLALVEGAVNGELVALVNVGLEFGAAGFVVVFDDASGRARWRLRPPQTGS